MPAPHDSFKAAIAARKPQIGPSDLAADMGHPGLQQVRRTVEDGIARTIAAGKPAGVLTGDPALAQHHLDLGATFVGLGSDVGLLTQGAGVEVMDVGVLGKPRFQPDRTNDAVAAASRPAALPRHWCQRPESCGRASQADNPRPRPQGGSIGPHDQRHADQRCARWPRNPRGRCKAMAEPGSVSAHADRRIRSGKSGRIGSDRHLRSDLIVAPAAMRPLRPAPKSALALTPPWRILSRHGAPRHRCPSKGIRWTSRSRSMPRPGPTRPCAA